MPVLLAGAGLVLAGPGAARATATVEMPAPTQGGGVGDGEVLRRGRPAALQPDPTPRSGTASARTSTATTIQRPAAAASRLDVTLHNVRSQPGYIGGLDSTDYFFQAYADMARTFDHGTSFVVRTERQKLLHTYYVPQSGWILAQYRQYPDRDFGPHFYMNFPAVEVTCPEGMTPTQYGLKVTNVQVTIADDNVFGHTTWSTPGPFYA